jgi:hypothetical protein
MLIVESQTLLLCSEIFLPHALFQLTVVASLLLSLLVAQITSSMARRRAREPALPEAAVIGAA